MEIRVYNTLERKKVRFVPLRPGKVSMYVCGPTVYDSCHIGHARSVVVFDVIARFLRSQGFEVTYVRNFTDVDDKIINRANQEGVSSQELAEKYIHEFHEDMDALNVERATHEPRATDHIDDIIRVIEILMRKGLAYEVEGDVYYSVGSSGSYGKLSGRKLEDMEAGARVDINDKKRDPFDFALWKASKPGEPAWPSPWGSGRPGWHIECSAMSNRFLGETFDIHGGGKDLIFPHHENEIAQSEAAFEKPFATYWVHNGFVNINHEKMSKSLGNFMMIRDVLKRYHPDAVRLFLLSNHYRSPVDFTDKSMDEATVGLDKIYALMERMESQGPDARRPERESAGAFWGRFCEAMADDFNTAKGIGILFEAVRQANRELDRLDAGEAPPDGELFPGRDEIEKICGLLGIATESPRSYFEAKRQKAISSEKIDEDRIRQLVREREEARSRKDWGRADQIRAQLETMNVVLEDRPDGTVWKIGQ